MACEVIGVMPKALASVSAGLNPLGGGRADRITAWTPLLVPEWAQNNRGVHLMLGVARLRSGASAALADAQLQALRESWSAADPAHHARGHFAVSRPLQEDIVDHQRDAWVLLGGAVTFVVLIVCVNIAALLVSNGEARRREFAVRHAAMESGGVSPGAGDRALAALLVVHGLVMNGGVHHALEWVQPTELSAAIEDYAYFGFDDVAAFLRGAADDPVLSTWTDDTEVEANRRYA